MTQVTVEGDHLVVRVPLLRLGEYVRAWLPAGAVFAPVWHLAERSEVLRRHMLTACVLGVRSAYKLGELTPR